MTIIRSDLTAPVTNPPQRADKERVTLNCIRRSAADIAHSFGAVHQTTSRHLSKVSCSVRMEEEQRSELHRLQSEDEIVSDIVAMANTDGGVLLLGVEDDGTITGNPNRSGSSIDPVKIRAMIYTKTVPNINTRISVAPVEGVQIVSIEVDQYPEICSTSQGKALHRIIDTQGKPQSVPFYPRDHLSRRIHV